MAHTNKVMRSINAPGGLLCVDIVRCPAGRFGYAEYRRDPEDGRGWQPTGRLAAPELPTQQAAIDAACVDIVWLAEALD